MNTAAKNTVVFPAGAQVPSGCGQLLLLGEHLVTRCGARPSTRGGRTVTLCSSCFSRLPSEAFVAGVKS